MQIDDRKQRVLTAIINIYASLGEPIGSNVLREYLDIQVSPATLRNEMAALTQLGLLIQPHTSAGRIPTMEGYRYYVDHLTNVNSLPAFDKEVVDELFSSLNYESDKLLQGVAVGLSELTNYTVLASAPKQPDLHIVHYEVIQVGKFSVTILGVSQNGGVYTRMANVKNEISAEDVKFLSVFLNTRMVFLSANDITQEKITDLARRLGGKAANLLPIISGAVLLLFEMGVPHIYVEGMENLLDYRDLDSSLRGVISLFSDKGLLEGLMTSGNAPIQYVFGDEIPGYYLPNLCLLSAKYAAGGGFTGALSIAGPARMNYAKLIPLLKYFTEKLGQTVTSGKKE